MKPAAGQSLIDLTENLGSSCPASAADLRPAVLAFEALEASGVLFGVSAWS